MSRKLFGGTVLAALCLVLFSCPNPLTELMVVTVKDETEPVIAVSSPAEGSYCANIVEVRGTVSDAATAAGADGQVRRLSYAVPGSAVSGTATVAADGSFVFQFSTVSLGSNFTLSIAAEDWNGNTGTVSIALQKQLDDGVPSFAASAGNHVVSLSWEPVPRTSSYALLYTTNGSLPSAQNGITVPGITGASWQLDDLANGRLHVFQLKTTPEAGWPESISDYVTAIPLSAQTLAPTVTGELRQIRVEWNAIPGASEFEVWRSVDQGGTYVNLSGPVSGTSYVDTSTAGDGWYWYKVRPTHEGSSLSAANGAQVDQFTLYRPAILSTCDLLDAEGVAISGQFAYVADRAAGLRVIDISDPSAAVLRGTCDTTDAADVAVNGSFAYVADGAAGLRVIDVTDPDHPLLRGTCNTDGYAGAVAIDASASYAYVADDDSGMQTILVSNPDAPVPGPTYAALNSVGVAVSGAILYLATARSTMPMVSGTLHVFDITAPGSPVHRGSCDVTDASGVAASGNYAYVAAKASGLRVVDASLPTAPALRGTCGTVYASNVAVAGSYALVAGGTSGLRVIDITDATSPVELSYCTSTWAAAVAANSAHAFVADSESGLRVISVAHPEFPMPMGTCATTNAQKVAVSGDYAYVADWTSGLRVIDVSRPDLPTLRGTFDTTSAEDVAISGSFAYIADYMDGLRIVDISRPSTPSPRGVCDPGSADAIAVSGDYAYVADQSGGGGLRVIDISDPDSPVQVGACPATAARDVAVDGRYAYLTSSTGLHVIDISDPTYPIIIGSYSAAPTSNPRGVVVRGSFLYVADWISGLTVFDISDPANPVARGAYTVAEAQDVSVAGSYACVVYRYVGMKVIDVSDPDTLVYRGTCATTDPYGVAASGAYAYVADLSSGLRVIDMLP